MFPTFVIYANFWRENWKEQIGLFAISSANFFSFSQILILALIFVNKENPICYVHETQTQAENSNSN